MINFPPEQPTPARTRHRERVEPTARAEDRIPVDQIDGKWLVVAVDPRRESRVYADLHGAAGVPCFRPLQRYVSHVETDAAGHTHNHRRWRPLFAGYLSFCVGHDDEATAIERHRDVRQRIPIVNQRVFVRQIAAMEQALRTNPELTTTPISPGVRCHITAGLWRGHVATVARVAGNLRVFVDLHWFGQAVETEIDRELLAILR